MSVVVLYHFSGRYSGKSEYEWRHPELGAVHKCILFLHQNVDVNEWSEAEQECQRYGFTDIKFSGHGKLQVEVLNTDEYRGFAGFYETALKDGSALVYYPNSPHNAPSAD